MASRQADSDLKTPFLERPQTPEPTPDEHPYERDNQHTKSKHLTTTTKVLLILYLPVIFALIYLITQISHRQPQPTCTTPDLLPNPARESGVITWQARPITVRIHNNPFSGAPRPEADQAWHDLLEHSNIVISQAELDRTGLTTLAMADGSGYVVQAAVGHQLHCLKRIRRWTYFDHYHAHDSEEQLRENRAHVDHCIELFRQEILCHGDQSFSTFSYDEVAGGPTAKDHSLHQCVDWPRLREWQVNRSVRLTTPGLFKLPAVDGE